MLSREKIRLPEIILAFVFDIVLGEPPNRLHPVVWMGRWISLLTPGRPLPGRVLPLLWGGGILLSGVGLTAQAGRWIENISHKLPSPVDVVLRAFILKSTFSFRALISASEDVYRALAHGDLPAARRWLSWHLVSRETHTLNTSQVAAATVESLAENLSDGIVAPLLYYLWGSLPAALVYRFINTADAMLGYRDATREWLGKIPARVDDAVNFVPSRLTAGLIVGAAPWGKGSPVRAWRVWRRDAAKTASPNAGHPMAAMAGALGVQLTKKGHYRLGAELPSPHTQDIKRAQHIVMTATGMFLLLIALISRWVQAGSKRA